MAFDPWAIPHDCEKHELAERMNRLSPSQRRIVRSYVRHVEFGEMTLSEWLTSDDAPHVAVSTWRKPANQGGNYWGTEESPNLLFRDAVQAYVTAMSRWQTQEEEDSVRMAHRTLRLAAGKAAAEMVRIVEHGSTDRDRINASKEVLNRASQETASKGTITVHGGMSIETLEEIEKKVEADVDQLEDEAGGEWQP